MGERTEILGDRESKALMLEVRLPGLVPDGGTRPSVPRWEVTPAALAGELEKFLRASFGPQSGVCLASTHYNKNFDHFMDEDVEREPSLDWNSLSAVVEIPPGVSFDLAALESGLQSYLQKTFGRDAHVILAEPEKLRPASIDLPPRPRRPEARVKLLDGTDTGRTLRWLLAQRPVNLEGTDLRGLDDDFVRKSYAGACFRKANLSGVVLQAYDFRRADFSHADLSRAGLNFSDFTGADLSYANLEGANLYKANLTGANLRGANLRRAHLRGAVLEGAALLDSVVDETTTLP